MFGKWKTDPTAKVSHYVKDGKPICGAAPASLEETHLHPQSGFPVLLGMAGKCRACNRLHENQWANLFPTPSPETRSA